MSSSSAFLVLQQQQRRRVSCVSLFHSCRRCHQQWIAGPSISNVPSIRLEHHHQQQQPRAYRISGSRITNTFWTFWTGSTFRQTGLFSTSVSTSSSSSSSFLHAPDDDIITKKKDTDTANPKDAACTGGESNKVDFDRLYQELVLISTEIRKHDELYYTNQRRKNATNASSRTEPEKQEELEPISDEEYDALVQREEDLCRQYPQLLPKWQEESGLGVAATRSGRVGAILAEEEDEEESPSSQAGSVPTSTTKRHHLTRMLSLENIHSTPDLLQWLERIRKKVTAEVTHLESVADSNRASTEDLTRDQVTIVTEPKLDGLSLSLRYRRTNTETPGSPSSSIFELEWAATRGDGSKGQDVTAAVRKSSSNSNNKSQLQIPLQMEAEHMKSPTVDSLEVRGEIVLPRSAFTALQEQLKQQQHVEEEEDPTGVSSSNNSSKITATKFSNARNAASGILLRKEDDNDEELTRLRSQLRFYAYDIVLHHTNSTSNLALDGLFTREQLSLWGFHVPEPTAVTQLCVSDNETTWNETDITSMLDYYFALEQHRDEMMLKETPTQLREKEELLSSLSLKRDKRSNSRTLKTAYIWGDYDMDGCVHKISESTLRHLLGTSNRAPRWAIAHKFPPRAAITALLDVIVQVGRTGALTPVAVLQPVTIGGVLVQRATLHNFGQVRQLLGRTPCNSDQLQGIDSDGVQADDGVLADRVPRGTLVMVSRAGDVIPQVLSRFDMVDPFYVQPKDGSKFILLDTPRTCPACGSEAIFDSLLSQSSSKSAPNDHVSLQPVSMGQVLRCGGPALLCPPRASLALQHAFSRDALDISGLSEARIRQLMNHGYLKTPSDLFQLAQNESKMEELAELEGWGPKSVKNLAQTANKVASEGVSLSRFLYSLGIRFVGIHSSALLAAAYGTAEAFLADAEKAANLKEEDKDDDAFELLRQECEETKGIGPAIVSSLMAFSRQKELVDAARELAQTIRVLDDQSLSASTQQSNFINDGDKPKPFSGMSVVFTGTIEGMKRTDVENLAKAMGAKSTPKSITKSTNLVVVGSRGGNKKLQEAEALGVRVVTSDEFLKILMEYQETA